nr:PREDICTED: gastrula zinc finger protein XlCGF26.1-like [Latimeria chalumnae]|eukprot:XP_006011368.1 PREDICTED: gastrula zinc finger protein XlCGF26.1-like [Latimeria chalumnae]
METVNLGGETDKIFTPDPEAVCDRASACSQEETSNMPANPDQLQPEETFEDIKMYFTKHEWAELQDWEKEVYKSLKEHYDIIISFGYYVSEPEFMCEIKETHQVSDCVSSHCSWDDSPVEPKTNAISNLIESPFPVPSNIQPINDGNIMEKAGGVELNENTYQHTVQKSQEIGTVQSKEYSFYGCAECKEKFNHLEALQRHLEIHENKQNQGTSYIRDNGHVMLHQEEVGGIERLEEKNCEESLTQSVDQQMGTGKKRSRCSKSQRLSGQQPSQLGQQPMHVGDKPKKSTMSSRKVKGLLIVNECQEILTTEKPYKCTECGKCFSQAGNLKTHRRIHTGEKPYKCTECGKCFTQEGNLKTHKRLHTGEKPYKCAECGKCFTRVGGLNSHKQTHTGEKPYKCTECEKSFTQLGNLKTHKRIHTGEKPYRCAECGKCFTRVVDLNKHKQIHTGEKPFKCTECGKCFTWIGDLKTHKQIHKGEKPYICTECGKSFTQVWGLNSHKKAHAGEKPYKCTYCGKSFTHIGNLNKHKRLHTGEKTYKCTECGKCFTRLGGLNSHKQTHTGKKRFQNIIRFIEGFNNLRQATELTLESNHLSSWNLESLFQGCNYFALAALQDDF